MSLKIKFAHQNGGPVTNQKINNGSRLQLDLNDRNYLHLRFLLTNQFINKPIHLLKVSLN